MDALPVAAGAEAVAAHDLPCLDQLPTTFLDADIPVPVIFHGVACFLIQDVVLLVVAVLPTINTTTLATVLRPLPLLPVRALLGI